MSFLNKKYWVLLAPYLWLTLFFILPFLIILKIALSTTILAHPPFTDLINFEGSRLKLHINWDNFAFLFQEPLFLKSYLSAVKIAFISAIAALLIGYPMAYSIYRSPAHLQSLLIFFVILPFFVPFLMRLYAWIGLLQINGLLNQIWLSLPFTSAPLSILHTVWAVYIGAIYCYLPFMILPIYISLLKIDPILSEAASDLGASPFQKFLRIFLPLSTPGIIAGFILVFIPIIGEYLIPELLGGASTLMIGKIIWSEFFITQDWPLASAISIIFLLLILIPLYFFNRYAYKNDA